eukprot:638112-Rhodomonas_salina.1
MALQPSLRQYRTLHSKRVGQKGHVTSTRKGRAQSVISCPEQHTLDQYRTSRSKRVGRYYQTVFSVPGIA